MKIVLVGAGNLATNIGKAFLVAGHEIVQVYSRTEKSASTLASALGCESTTTISSVTASGDVYILALKDSVLADVAKELIKGREDKLFVHTAGSMPMSTLSSSRRGVFYPMQTFSKNKEVDFHNIPCFIEASSEQDLQLLGSLASSVSDNVRVLDSDNRCYLHLAAVFCCNFANHCCTLASRLLQQHGNIPFDVMLPLVDETFSKLHHLSPDEAQTGPAVRWDTNVMDKHLQLLASDKNMQVIYKLMSESIHNDKL